MELSTLKVAKKDRVAYITLTRPEALNAISPQVLDDLRQAIAAVGDECLPCPPLPSESWLSLKNKTKGAHLR